MRVYLPRKRCCHCGRSKEISEFPENRALLDGRHSWCRRCCIGAKKAWVESHPELARLTQAQQYFKRKYGAFVPLPVPIVGEVGLFGDTQWRE